MYSICCFCISLIPPQTSYLFKYIITEDTEYYVKAVIIASSARPRALSAEGAFVYIGTEPMSKIYEEQISMDKWGYILATEDTKTNVEGVFVAGDIRTKAIRQVVTAASDGAVRVTQPPGHPRVLMDNCNITPDHLSFADGNGRELHNLLSFPLIHSFPI